MSDIHRWLDERQALADAATPGPWDVRSEQEWHEGFDFFDPDRPDGAFTFPVDLDTPDRDFIAAARTDEPKLLAMCRKLIEQRDGLIDAVDTNINVHETAKMGFNAELLAIAKGEDHDAE